MPENKKFWEFKNEAGKDELFIHGTIAEESWFDDEVTPKMFKDELNKCKGPVDVWINSPGGDVFAASEIYTALLNYADKVTVKIDGMAASAASVIAMAGDKILMSPTAQMMIHNPSTIAFGDRNDMKDAIAVLDSIKESIINAYERKTKLGRNELSEMMNKTTWMDAKLAIEKGFADEMIEKTGGEGTKQNALFNKEDFCKVFASVNENLFKKMVAKYTPTTDLEIQNKSGVSGEENKMDIKDSKELRAAAPEIFDEAIKEAVDNAVQAAIKAERERLQAIEEIAPAIGDEALIKDAKYDNPCNASDLALRAVQDAAKNGQSFLNNMISDNDNSGAKEVTGAISQPASDEKDKALTPAERMEAGRKAAKDALKKQEAK